jgi:hypothetical protein
MKKINYFTKLAFAFIAIAIAGFTVAPYAAAKGVSIPKNFSSYTVSQFESYVKKNAKNLSALEAYVNAYIGGGNAGSAGQIMQFLLGGSISSKITSEGGYQSDIISFTLGVTAGANSNYVSNVAYFAAAGAPGLAVQVAQMASQSIVSNGAVNQAANLAAAIANAVPSEASQIASTITSQVSSSPGAPSSAQIAAAAQAGASSPSGSGATVTGGTTGNVSPTS